MGRMTLITMTLIMIMLMIVITAKLSYDDYDFSTLIMVVMTTLMMVSLRFSQIPFSRKHEALRNCFRDLGIALPSTCNAQVVGGILNLPPFAKHNLPIMLRCQFRILLNLAVA